MRRLYWSVTILAIVVLVVHPALAAKKGKTDHPLVKPYEGSKIYSKDVKEFDEYNVFKGWDKATKKYNTQTLEGKITGIRYKNPPERSVLELYRNYQSALEKEQIAYLILVIGK